MEHCLDKAEFLVEDQVLLNHFSILAQYDHLVKVVHPSRNSSVHNTAQEDHSCYILEAAWVEGLVD